MDDRSSSPATTAARGDGTEAERGEPLSWRPLRAADLPMLAEWLAEPVVARWWCHDTTPEAIERDFGPSTRGEESGEDLVVLLGDRPVGLLQRYLISDYPEDLHQLNAVVDVPPGAAGIDYLLADAADRGRGLGPHVIATAVERIWADYPEATAVIVPVVAANRASWRALERAGLRRVAEGDLPPDNPIDEPLHYIYRVDRPR